MLTREDASKIASESQQLKELDGDPLSPISVTLFGYGKNYYERGKCTLSYIYSLPHFFWSGEWLGSYHHIQNISGYVSPPMHGNFSLKMDNAFPEQINQQTLDQII